ncbi:anti-sigma factor [Aureimonas mangrovi]|uniref:anti-sigma factor n=1 Tax=Aureimonas mangrovi TaxID=2758041 RepID=UPI00163D99CC|nr:anti-sigma factor [Aureimonas mangrovi]
MTTTPEEFDDKDFLAADYALGVLDGAQRAAAERLMRRDAAFRAEVDAWEDHLAPLAMATTPQTPPTRAWEEIEAGLPRLTPVEPARTPAAAPAREEGLVPGFWRWLALGSGGLALACLAALAFVLSPATTLPGGEGEMTFAASTITSDADGVPIFAVVLDPSSGTATLVPIRPETEDGRVPELWLVRQGGTPQSLGVFDPERPLRISLDPAMMEGDLTGGQLAISLEPEGGSPTGQPTGPVLGHGVLQSI